MSINENEESSQIQVSQLEYENLKTNLALEKEKVQNLQKLNSQIQIKSDNKTKTLDSWREYMEQAEAIKKEQEASDKWCIDKVNDAEEKASNAVALKNISEKKLLKVNETFEKAKLKIEKLESILYKREQSEQTIYMNKPKDPTSYKFREGIGFENKQTLKKVCKGPLNMIYNNINFDPVDWTKLGFVYSSEMVEEEDKKRANHIKSQLKFRYDDLNESYNLDSKTHRSDDYFRNFDYKENELENKVTTFEYSEKPYKSSYVLQKELEDVICENKQKATEFEKEKQVFINKISNLENKIEELNLQIQLHKLSFTNTTSKSEKGNIAQTSSTIKSDIKQTHIKEEVDVQINLKKNVFKAENCNLQDTTKSPMIFDDLMNSENEYPEEYNDLFKASEETLINNDIKSKSQKQKNKKKLKKKEVLKHKTMKKLESTSTEKNLIPNSESQVNSKKQTVVKPKVSKNKQCIKNSILTDKFFFPYFDNFSDYNNLKLEKEVKKKKKKKEKKKEEKKVKKKDFCISTKHNHLVTNNFQYVKVKQFPSTVSNATCLRYSFEKMFEIRNKCVMSSELHKNLLVSNSSTSQLMESKIVLNKQTNKTSPLKQWVPCWLVKQSLDPKDKTCANKRGPIYKWVPKSHSS